VGRVAPRAGSENFALKISECGSFFPTCSASLSFWLKNNKPTTVFQAKNPRKGSKNWTQVYDKCDAWKIARIPFFMRKSF
jgi:hypothetical protein